MGTKCQRVIAQSDDRFLKFVGSTHQNRDAAKLFLMMARENKKIDTVAKFKEYRFADMSSYQRTIQRDTVLLIAKNKLKPKQYSTLSNVSKYFDRGKCSECPLTT